MFVAPSCLVVLLLGLAATWDRKIPQAFGEWWHYLLPNAALAFVLNVTVATLIKEVSAVGFMLTGVVKDIVLVVVSAAAFGEQVAPMQVVCFSMILGGILFWSLMKAAPE